MPHNKNVPELDGENCADASASKLYIKIDIQLTSNAIPVEVFALMVSSASADLLEACSAAALRAAVMATG